MNGVVAGAAIISGVIGVVLFLGTVVVYLRGSRDKGTIATLEASNRALTERVSLLEADATLMTARLTLLERENAELHKQRPSAEAIAELRDLVENASALLARHDSQTMALLRKVAP